MAAEVRIQTFVQLIKFCGGRQFSASKSPTSCSCKTLWASLKNDRRSAKAKGLTTQCDRKEK